MPEGIVTILRFFLVQSTNSNILKICTAKSPPLFLLSICDVCRQPDEREVRLEDAYVCGAKKISRMKWIKDKKKFSV